MGVDKSTYWLHHKIPFPMTPVAKFSCALLHNFLFIESKICRVLRPRVSLHFGAEEFVRGC